MTVTLPRDLASRTDTRLSVREAFTRDETGMPGRMPRAVVHAHTTSDVVDCVRWASGARVPIIPVGAGTSLEGHLLALGDEIMLDLTEMADIVAVSPSDFTAVVQPGVTRSRLGRALAPHGVHFPVDPGADATLGGMAATNASGATSVRYGGMRPNVLALQAVMADGSVHRFGRAVAKTSSGYDLKDLMIGSAGTLGVITEVTLRLHPVPDAAGSVRLAFPSVDVEATSTAARTELLDAVEAIAADRGMIDAQRAETATDRESLWQDRHRLFWAIKAAHPGHRFLVTDTAIPFSEIVGAVAHAHRVAADMGLSVTTAGHIGDGNVHVVVPHSGGTLDRARRFSDAVVAHALSVGGTATGEHGIGLAKKKYLGAEHGSACGVMAAVKTALDPLNLLNPGKILDP